MTNDDNKKEIKEPDLKYQIRQKFPDRRIYVNYYTDGADNAIQIIAKRLISKDKRDIVTTEMVITPLSALAIFKLLQALLTSEEFMKEVDTSVIMTMFEKAKSYTNLESLVINKPSIKQKP